MLSNILLAFVHHIPHLCVFETVKDLELALQELKYLQHFMHGTITAAE